MIAPVDQTQIDDLCDEIRVCGDPFEKARLGREVERLRLLQAEHARAAGQLKADQVATLADGAARTAASKARYDRQQGTLRSEVEVQDREADAFMLLRLRANGKLQLAHKRIGERKLYPTHARLSLACYVDELKAAQPELAPFVDDIVARGELPTFASPEKMRELEARLYLYAPPPPPPPAWPDPVEAYVAVGRMVIEGVYAERSSLTWIDPFSGIVQPMAGGNYGAPTDKSRIIAVLERGAKIAWAPGIGRRVMPPKIEIPGADWQPTPAGDGWVLVVPDGKAVSK